MVKIFLLLFTIVTSLYSQGRSDFYDPYNYELDKFKSDTFDDMTSYKEYSVPPSYPKQGKSSSKNVSKGFDPTAMVPRPNTTGKLTPNINNPSGGILPAGMNLTSPNALLSATAQTNASTNTNQKAPIFNPLTGEINPKAFSNQNQNQNQNQANEKLRRFENIEKFSETKYERMKVIFFMTLPFAGGVSAAAVALLGGAKFVKTTGGGALIMSGAVSLAGYNAWIDAKEWEEVMRKKKDEQANEIQNNSYHKHDYQLSFKIGEQKF